MASSSACDRIGTPLHRALPGRARNLHRLAEERSARLGRAVDDRLHAAELEVLLIGAAEHDPRLADDARERPRVGQRYDVEEQALLGRRALEQRELRGAGRAVLDRRVPVRGVVELRGAQRLEHLFGARLGKLRRGREERRLHHQAGRLLAAGLAQDLPARRRGRLRADAHRAQRRGVEHRAVARHMDHRDGIAREARVEIVARELARPRRAPRGRSRIRRSSCRAASRSSSRAPRAQRAGAGCPRRRRPAAATRSPTP